MTEQHPGERSDRSGQAKSDGAVAQPAPELQGREAEAAQSLFGDRLELAQRYVEHLASSGIVRGLIGPREAPRLWGRHVLNCAVVEELIPQDARVADVGSGAGLPGLCLAIARPDLELTLIEPLERRVTWLNEIVQDLQLENVQVLRARGEQVEELPGGSAPDVVTSRAVSALGGLLDFTLPLLQGSGELLALKGRSAQQEIDKARKQLKRHRVAQTEVLTLGSELLEEPTTVVRVVL
ncbi:16S rRNA (guanine(527)-N(7))-methyltransferase RsmG [Kocuria sp. SL71]|uniref:16S rRNA (guanine(527)-N(7))-methyltransferase RsmG n=1 Tax=Kocuria sp. SL71 TaxID=2995151 RepID=UPI002272B512|nr:16S rRNA (guanine(527)-N(7))-methyltransferase RsmG [Kocuria sp. SL71]MCY1684785.1 16S rRNA (guanine(527)-N(7))-methyltransferase RsmG [Kocuria sp. SL71]